VTNNKRGSGHLANAGRPRETKSGGHASLLRVVKGDGDLAVTDEFRCFGPF